MTTRDMKKALVALAAVALPVGASSFEWGGRVGVVYNRSDYYTDSVHGYSPRLDLDLKLDGRGFLAHPGIVFYSLGGTYRRLATSTNGQSTGTTDALSYHAELALLRNRTSPLTLEFSALRADARLSDVPAQAAGDSVLERYGTVLRLAPRALPRIDASYQLNRQESSVADLVRHSKTDHLVSATMNQLNPSFGVLVDYSGDWSSGSWEADQYQTHRVTASAHSQLVGTSRFQLQDSYFERIPTALSTGSYFLGLNSFAASWVNGVGYGDRASIRYANVRGESRTLSGTTESASQSLRADMDLKPDEADYWLRLVGAITTSDQRGLTSRIQSGGESAGAQAWWRSSSPGRIYELGTGPSIGVLHLPAEPDRLGYGAMGSGRVTRDWRAYQVVANYQVDWASNLGSSGWSLTQSLGASIGGPLGAARADASFVAATRRGWSPALGDDASRSIQLLANYSRSPYALYAQASLASGLVGSAPNEFIGDGLFLPARFDSNSRALTLGGNAAVIRNMEVRLQGKYWATSGPGQPTYSALEGTAMVAYRYASLDLSLEDRVMRAEAGGKSQLQNLVMFRLTRSIGSRF